MIDVNLSRDKLVSVRVLLRENKKDHLRENLNRKVNFRSATSETIFTTNYSRRKLVTLGCVRACSVMIYEYNVQEDRIFSRNTFAVT